MTRYHIERDIFDYPVVHLDGRGCPDGECTDSRCVHVFASDELGRDRHHVVAINDQQCRMETGHGPVPTHVAIPIEQYRIIFGAL